MIVGWLIRRSFGYDACCPTAEGFGWYDDGLGNGGGYRVVGEYAGCMALAESVF